MTRHLATLKESYTPAIDPGFREFLLHSQNKALGRIHKTFTSFKTIRFAVFLLNSQIPLDTKVPED